MSARQPVRRKMTAREAAERLGISERTVRSMVAEPREEFLARAAQRREQVSQLRAQGLSHAEIAVQVGCPIGTVGRILHQLRKQAAAQEGLESAESA